LPQDLQNIIKDEKRRKKLIIYINPPYAESAGKGTLHGKEGRKDIGISKIRDKYKTKLSQGSKELFAQFLIRIHEEIKGCKIAEFSKLKAITGSNFAVFRQNFKVKFCKGFLVPANSFDNVHGNFPIGFKIWDTDFDKKNKDCKFDAYDKAGSFLEVKKVLYYNGWKRLNAFLSANCENKIDIRNVIGFIYTGRNDFQHTNLVNVNNSKNNENRNITISNLIQVCVYFAVQKVIPATWLNDRDQFLFPNKKWEKDIEFQNDCLVYTIFNNNISAKNGVNHWIPFKETEIGAQSEYESHTLISFLSGEKVANAYSDLFSHLKDKTEKQSGLNWQQGQKREFSVEAQAVFDAGKEIWKYYHGQDIKFFEFKFGKEKYNVNASLYDIREYFQGRSGNGRMNAKSEDEKYNELIGNLREKLNLLAQKIEPKVYEYEFLLK